MKNFKIFFDIYLGEDINNQHDMVTWHSVIGCFDVD